MAKIATEPTPAKESHPAQFLKKGRDSEWKMKHLAQCIEMSGRQRSTYWLMKRLEGLHGVAIPATALVGSEGLLEGWISTTSMGDRKSALSVIIVSHDVVQTNLLRFEAHLQDLASTRLKKTMKLSKRTSYDDVDNKPIVCVAIATQQLDAGPRLLTEHDLDRLIRTLCARELTFQFLSSESLNTTDEKEQISANDPTTVGYNGPTPFCLQEHISGSNKVVVATLEMKSNLQSGAQPVCQISLHEENVSTECSCKCCASGQHERMILGMTTATIKQKVQEIVTRLLLHLREHHGIRLLAVELEFVLIKLPKPGSTSDIALIAARAIQVAFTPSDANMKSFLASPRVNCTELSYAIDADEKARCGDEERITWQFNLPSLPNSNCKGKQRSMCSADIDIPTLPRVCRQCRGPLDVALANELKHERATTRSALAKLDAIQTTAFGLEETRKRLENQIQQLINERDEWMNRCQALAEHHDRAMTAIQRQLSEARELRSMALEDVSWHGGDTYHWQAHEARVKRQVSLLVEAQFEQQYDALVDQWRSDWLASVASIQAQVDRAKEESARIERDREQLMRTQTKLEIIRAERDELRFQWRHVVRQLTDIKTRGVQLPARVAGGFSSYPSPSPENVRSVVKWIVDYEVKRVALEGRNRTKSVGKRLKMKLDLMRALAGHASVSPTKKQKSKTSLLSKTPSSVTARGLALALEYSPERSIRLAAGRITSSSPLRHSSRVLILSPSSSSSSGCSRESPRLSPTIHSPPITLVRASSQVI